MSSFLQMPTSLLVRRRLEHGYTTRDTIFHADFHDTLHILFSHLFIDVISLTYIHMGFLVEKKCSHFLMSIPRDSTTSRLGPQGPDNWFRKHPISHYCGQTVAGVAVLSDAQPSSTKTAGALKQTLGPRTFQHNSQQTEFIPGR